MTKSEFLNKDISRILSLSPRVIVHWTEKGLVIPTVKNAEGAGKKRIYGYVNLLEFGICKELFDIGLGFHGVKRISDHIRKTGELSDWTNNFEDYYRKQHQYLKESLKKYRQQALSEKDKQLIEYIEQSFSSVELFKNTEATGMLILSFNKKNNIKYFIAPWEKDLLGIKTALRELQDDIVESKRIIIIDLADIKKNIDSKV